MNVLLLTHYFWPEVGSPQVTHLDWARRFAEWGHRVVVVTGFPNYPDGRVRDGYRGRWFMREEHAGVEIIRMPTLPAENTGTVRRLINHLSVAASSLLAVPVTGAIDVVVTQYPPLFTALSGLALSQLRRVPHVLYAADLWVEVAIEMGAIKSKVAQKVALAASTACIRASAHTIITSPGCIAKLERVGIETRRMTCIPNSVDSSLFAPDPARRRRVRSAYGWTEETTVCLYSGTHGASQGLVQVLDAAALLSADRGVRFAFFGDGTEKQLLRQHAAQRSLTNVDFHDALPSEEMPGLIDAADVGLVPLTALPAFTTTLPLKMFEIMAMAKPVVLAAHGDARAIVEEAGCGLCVAPQAPGSFARAVATLAASPALRTQMGDRGRATAAAYSRMQSAKTIEALLRDVTRTT